MVTMNKPQTIALFYLLPVASKVCDKVVLDQFNSYLLENNRLPSHQSGNKKYFYTETLNIFVIDSILKAMDNKMLTALVLLDLSKAFDSVKNNISCFKNWKCLNAL